MAKIEFLEAAGAVGQQPMLGVSGRFEAVLLFNLSDAKSVWAEIGISLAESVDVALLPRYQTMYFGDMVPCSLPARALKPKTISPPLVCFGRGASLAENNTSSLPTDLIRQYTQWPNPTD
jgi:hypothetical protein